jgi:hypothetical protein
MRRIIAIALFALVIAPASFAGETLPTSGAPAFIAAHARKLAPLFVTNSEVVVSGNGMLMMEPPAPDVLLARRATDGSLVTACVATPEAAATFLSPDRTPGPARPLQK